MRHYPGSSKISAEAVEVGAPEAFLSRYGPRVRSAKMRQRSAGSAPSPVFGEIQMRAKLRHALGMAVTTFGLLVAPSLAMAQSNLTLPPPPNCAPLPEGPNKLSCLATATVHSSCASTAKSKQEFDACMRSKLSPPQKLPQGVGGSQTPSCDKVPEGPMKQMCLAEATNASSCAATSKNQNEYNTCMFLKKSPPPAPLKK